MNSNWKKTSLADVSEKIEYGFTASATDENTGTKFLRITDIQNGFVQWRDVPFCEIDSSSKSKYLLNDGDIVVARTGNSTGENYLFQGESFVVFASYLIRFRVNKQIVDPSYVWRCMRSSSWWNFVRGSKTGSAQAGANAKVLGRFEFEYPPLHEQKAIAHIIGTLDKKIEINQKTNETLEEIAKALFKSWFIDFDPVKAKVEGLSTGLPDEISNLFPDSFEDSELGEIPKGWQVKELDEIADLSGGYAFKSKDYTTKGSFIVRTLNIGEDSFINKKDAVFIEKDKFDEFRKFELLEGDTLFVMVGATLGKIGLVSSDIVPSLLNQNMWRIRSKNNSIDQMFTYYSFSNKVKEITSWVSGSARGFLRREDCRKLKIIVPPNKICERYEKIALLLFKKRTSNIVSNMLLEELRDTLLPRLVSGELIISDAERMIDEVGI